MDLISSALTVGGGRYYTENELRKCSRCHSTLLLSFFDKNRKGEHKRCCKNCKKNKDVYNFLDHLTDYGKDNLPKLHKELILDAREKHIDEMKSMGLKFVGLVDKSEYKTTGPELNNDEILIEHQLFKKVPTGCMILVRWRMRLTEALLK